MCIRDRSTTSLVSRGQCISCGTVDAHHLLLPRETVCPDALGLEEELQVLLGFEFSAPGVPVA
eukprot:12699493-Prorocentrum_lima.AAC.1